MPPSDEDGATTGWEGDDELASGEDMPLPQLDQPLAKRLLPGGPEVSQPAEPCFNDEQQAEEGAAAASEPLAEAAAASAPRSSSPAVAAPSSSSPAVPQPGEAESLPPDPHLNHRPEANGRVHSEAVHHSDEGQQPPAAHSPDEPPSSAPRALYGVPSDTTPVLDALPQRMEAAAAAEAEQAAAAALPAPQALSVQHQRTPSDDAESTASTTLREVTPCHDADGDSTPGSAAGAGSLSHTLHAPCELDTHAGPPGRLLSLYASWQPSCV